MTLDELFKLLNENTHNGTLNLIPETLSDGAIASFYRRLTTSGALVISDVVVRWSDDHQAIVVEGKSSDFAIGPLTMHSEFTEAALALSYDLTGVFAQTNWQLPGIQWFSLRSPGFHFSVADAEAIQILGSISGTIEGGFPYRIELPIPTMKGDWLLKGAFPEEKPNIARFYQLIGGTNLAAFLPAPVSTFADLSVTTTELLYNFQKSELTSIGIGLETTQEWPLWPGLSLSSLRMHFLVLSPASKERAVSFTLNGGFKLEDAQVELSMSYPERTLSGAMTSDSPPVDLTALLKRFLPDTTVDLAARITTFSILVGLQSPIVYGISCTMDTDWPIIVLGQEIFRITQLNFNIEGLGSSVTGSIGGQTLVLSTFTLVVVASYLGSKAGWRFEGKQTSGAVAVADLLATYLHWDSPPSFRLDIDGLELSIETGTSSFEFAGMVIGEWNPPIQSGISVSGTLRARIGYNGGSETLGPDLVRVGRAEMPIVLTGEQTAVVLLPAAGVTKKRGWFGEVSLDITWNGIELTLFYDFAPDSQRFGITWGKLTGLIEEKEIKGKKHQIATLRFAESTTLGSMVETMVSWLTGSKFALGAPWSVLNGIKLNKFALVYDFTDSKVSLDIAIGPIELGIARIESVSLSYNSGSSNPDENGVIVTLNGSFLWQSNPKEPLSWDAARPETTKGPPGGGNKYLDLRLLALGQHVVVEGIEKVTNVQQAIAALAKLPVPKQGELPAIKLDAGSSWLIGIDFGVLRLEEGEKGGYLLTLQIVFNDPRLYGLRVALAGKAAKFLSDLDFQILYRQVSETVGVYQAEITLPSAIRRLSVGAYTITLPVFGIALYTNGDFQIDLGFPWNTDFSRSFTIEAIIYPGIPLLGAAGLYFGKLSSASTNRVPATTRGLFNPVLVFGFGAQMGFGKSLEYGVFKAGFSLTIVGILEGVLAKWNPYTSSASSALLPQVGDSQVQGAYYFWLRGALGIVGKLYGSVDFAIVKADVTVQIILLVQITFEAYAPIVLTVMVSVDVSVKVQINLGLFKINIHLTFSLQIKETFSILTSGTAPWGMEALPLPGLLRAPLAHRLLALREVLGPLARTSPTPNWSNLLPATEPLSLSGYLAPAFTMAGDAATSLDQQQACAIALLFIRSVPPVTQDTRSSAQKALGQLADTSFEVLCKQILRWAIASIQEKPLSADEVDRLIVSDEQLLSLFNVLSADDFSLPLAAIETFLGTQFVFTVQLPPQEGESDATFFPLAMPLELDIPDYGDWKGYRYTFADYNTVSADFLGKLRTYFNELAVQVEQENASGRAASPAVTNAEISVGGFVFGDYFLLLCRQMLQAARAALRDFTYHIPASTTVREIIRQVNEAGDLNGSFTLFDLFAANPTHPLNPQRALTIAHTFLIQEAAETFASLSTTLGSAFSATELAQANATNETLLRPGAQINYPERPAYSVQAHDDLLKIANHFSVNLGDLLSRSGLLEQQGLFQLPASLFLPSVTYQVLAGDSFEKIAQMEVYGSAFSARELAWQNAGRTILRPGTVITYPGRSPYAVLVDECLGDVARHFEVSLAMLLEQTDILTSTEILAVCTSLAIPPFVTHTASGDTLQRIARRFNTTIAVLAASEANLSLIDLFDATTAPNLDLPHLPRYRVAELIAEIQRSLGLQQLSGMTSRYYLHGMRLPTAGITPNHRGMWVKEDQGSLTLPEQAGLYALIGQQFPLPEIAGEPFVIHLNRPAELKWLRFAGANPDQLTITIESASLDNQRLQAVRTYARAHRLPVDLVDLGREVQVSHQFATYPFSASLPWQSAATISLPYGKQTDGIAALRLWELPAALTNLPDRESRALDPRFKVQVARYDEASGATINEELASYAWASTLEFTIKKVPVGAEASVDLQRPALRTTYEVVGAGGKGIVLLERLLNRVGNDENFFAHLLLGYPPDQAGDARRGIQTDAPDAVTMGIAQVNLSTDTRPPGTLSGLEAGPTMLNSRIEFLRLLWEASITRSGGFYLYYYNAGNKEGLPERIFNDKGEATLTLIVLYSKPAASSAQDRLTEFMNALATAEPVDTEQAVVFAEANPVRPGERIVASPTDTLASLAYRYYGDVGELARDNADVPLTARVSITITQGIYEVSPAGVEPGGDLARIATYFGTTVQAIKDANPRIQAWPNPLPLFMAIRLPRIDVLVGSSPGGTTLGQLARFYGESVTELAAENQGTPGFFAAGQTLLISGGPLVNNPTVVAGVMAVETRRPVPPPVPDRPKGATDDEYGKLFLLHAYTLLSYQVSENAEFLRSPLGLPAGPTTEAAENFPGKIRVPKELAAGDLWEYRQALPYPKFARQVYRAADGLPDPAESPYRALGRLLQIEFAWQDLYGNRLLTTLSHPQAGDQGPLNQKPFLTGYSDLLTGLGQWPAVSSGWHVLPGAAGARPRLEIVLSFDNSPYQGLLSASARNTTTLLARFTRQLDPGSAGNPANYRLDKGIGIQGVRLLSDGESVELTVSSLADGEEYTLTADNIKSLQDGLIFGGQASFHYPDEQGNHSSTVQEHAARDLAVYTRLYYQLSDPNGVELSIQTSLLKDEALPLPDAGVAALLAWIGTIYTFLADRAQAGNRVPVPPEEHRIGEEIALDRLNTKQIFELNLTLQITRHGGTVASDLATVAGIRQVSTAVAPLVQRIREENDTLGLSLFARQFQDALSVQGAYRLKVASGVDRFRLSLSQTGSTLWAVRLGLADEDTTGIYYSVKDKGVPAIFAPRPISNRLESHSQVPIYDYASGQGIDFTTPSRRLDFVAIDMDLWVRQFFAAIDGVLSPEFTAAIQIVDARKQQTQLADLLASKKTLANLASRWMIPVFTDEQVDSGTIQQVFEQQMLQQLSNAYTTRAGIQFQAKVRADIHEDHNGLQPAQLLGTIIQNESSESTQSKITLTSPRLTLQTGESRPLAFLLTAPDVVVDTQGRVVPNLVLNLSYAGNQIEHQIGRLPGIDNYVASSWLSFIIPESGRPFDDTLGQFPVPLVLRSYPDSPTMIEQMGNSPEMPGETLEQLARWNYRFTYALPFHYPQDTLYGEVRLNVGDTAQGDFVDAFASLAEFITVFPAVNQDLRDVLASIDARTTDQKVIDTAAIALISFNLMVKHVVQAAEKNGNLFSATSSATSDAQEVRAGDSYNFSIQEGCIQQDGVEALLIALYGQPPTGVIPEVLVDPEVYTVQPIACDGVDCSGEALQGDFCFWYKHRETGRPLSATEGQRISDRQIRLKGLDLLKYQDAEASVSLRRNEKLDPVRTPAEPFIYTTGRITFANPFHPTVDSGEQVIEIASIGSGTPPRPMKRSFEQHMQALFAALLKENTQKTLTIQVEIRYDFAIHSELNPVPLPILFQPPQTIEVIGQENNSLAQMILNWQEALQRWGTQNTPQTQSGVFWLELTLMSQLTSQPMPLLRLRLLRLPLEYVDPPLW